MRGDSLRDLYAKTLAVFGLGLLAAAGAIVDYWPVGGELPGVTGSQVFRPAMPIPVQNLQLEIPAPSANSLVRVRTVTPRRGFSDSLRKVTFVPAPEPTVAPAPEAAPIPEMDAIQIEDPTSILLASMIDVQIDLEPPAELSAGSQEDPRWSFAGAIRRTRESLKDARAFLGTKLIGVVGAFRKVSPFWDTTAVTQLR